MKGDEAYRGRRGVQQRITEGTISIEYRVHGSRAGYQGPSSEATHVNLATREKLELSNSRTLTKDTCNGWKGNREGKLVGSNPMGEAAHGQKIRNGKRQLPIRRENSIAKPEENCKPDDRKPTCLTVKGVLPTRQPVLGGNT